MFAQAMPARANSPLQDAVQALPATEAWLGPAAERVQRGLFRHRGRWRTYMGRSRYDPPRCGGV